MDIAISKFIQSMESGFFNLFFSIFYYFGHPIILLFVGAFLYYCVSKKFNYKFTATYTISMFFNSLFKQMFKRIRPYKASNEIKLLIETDSAKVAGHSMPSGHAMMVSAYAVPILREYGYNKDKKKRLWMFIVVPLAVLFVGLARVYMGAHYFTDIFVGFILGFGIACLVEFAFYKLKDNVYLWGLTLIPVMLLLLFIFPEKDSGAVSTAILIPVLIGGFLDKRFINLDVEGSKIYVKIIRYLIACAGAGLFLVLAGAIIMEPWLAANVEGTKAYEMAYLWSYFFIFFFPCVWIYVICPYIFKYVPKLFKKTA